MMNIESNLKDYLEKCRLILESYSTHVQSIEPLKLAYSSSSPIYNFIKEAESSTEFDNFTVQLQSEILKKDLNRLSSKQQKLIEKSQKEATNANRAIKPFNKVEWCQTISRHAAHRFFVNNGTYYKIWNKQRIDKSELLEELIQYPEQNKSEFLKLFVFDGVVLYDENQRVEHISVPNGKIGVYTESELENLLRLPQLSFANGLKKDIVKNLSIWHILTTDTIEPYRGRSGAWFGSLMLSPLGWNENEVVQWENDLEKIAPIFLCAGSDLNLAEIIEVRTNIFETSPVIKREINGYLPHDRIDEEGDFHPRNNLIRIGKNGIILQNIYKLWSEMNKLSKAKFLTYPTQNYIRAVLNRHKSSVYDQSLMHIFVLLISAIESLLTPDGNQELLYKTSIRSASLISDDPPERFKHFTTIRECYKTRSFIVHEGHTNNKKLDQIIDIYLLPFVQYLLIRYMILLHLFLNQEIHSSMLPSLDQLQTSKASKAIDQILDIIILNTNIVTKIEEKLQEWDMPNIRWENRFSV